ncbi:MAG: hypothetical protein E6Q61_02640 [Nitrosomonas sp.]|nr:MAG: hypothetical protein E6Q61_02640 [Nitrosomonas sp.]HMU63111.1 hypothetical protein [Nitrosomonas sp.]HMV12674.1 hypothetical protein [Nitrosomonas sp.]HMW20256.1 hypothetical protein [Nitrosomonas sp.]HMW69313.1 hypothetical protein [Nitrosomonas sp.]
MKVMVIFKTGTSQVFIVPRDILAVEFRRLAESVGGEIHRIEFMQKNKFAAPKYALIKDI